MLRAFICQWHNSLTEAELMLWHDSSVIRETETLLKGLFLQEIAELSPCCLHLNPSRWGDPDKPSQVLTP